MTIRTILVAALLVTGLGACSRSDPPPVDNEATESADTNVTSLDASDREPDAGSVPIDDAADRLPPASGNAAAEVPVDDAAAAPPPPTVDERMMDDATATGMTARSSRGEAVANDAPTNDTATKDTAAGEPEAK